MNVRKKRITNTDKKMISYLGRFQVLSCKNSKCIKSIIKVNMLNALFALMAAVFTTKRKRKVEVSSHHLCLVTFLAIKHPNLYQSLKFALSAA